MQATHLEPSRETNAIECLATKSRRDRPSALVAGALSSGRGDGEAAAAQ